MNNLIEQRADEVASLLIKHQRESILEKAVIQIRRKGIEKKLKKSIKKAQKELDWNRLKNQTEATNALISHIKASKQFI
jgi:uncharacterized membrane protein